MADADGDLEAAVDSLLERAERPPEQEVVTPKQAYLQLNNHHHHAPPQQNGHSPWQSTPTQPGKPPKTEKFGNCLSVSVSSMMSPSAANADAKDSATKLFLPQYQKPWMSEHDVVLSRSCRKQQQQYKASRSCLCG